MKALIAAVSLVALGSCNELVTQTALFSRSDAAKAFPLRSGVWRRVSDDPCKFDVKKSAAQWPNCAGGTVIVDSTLATYQSTKGPPVLTPVVDMLVADGSPMIVQFSAPAGTPAGQGFFYGGLRVTKRDDQGRVIGFTFWELPCGPPSQASSNGPATGQPSSDNQASGAATAQLYPGLTQVKDSSDCTTDSQQVVRDAAAASEKSATSATVAWVRDGDT